MNKDVGVSSMQSNVVNEEKMVGGDVPEQDTNKWKQVRKEGTKSADVSPTSDDENKVDATQDEYSDLSNTTQEKKNIEEDYIVLQKEHMVLQKELEETKKELEETKQVLRQAEIARYHDDKNHEKALKFAGSKIIESFFGLRDSVEAAHQQTSLITLEDIETGKKDVQDLVRMIEQIEKGMHNVVDMMTSIFEKLDVVAIDPMVGEAFDPNLHSAIATQPSESAQAPNTIMKVLRKGYRLHERVLRPAMVTISQAGE